MFEGLKKFWGLFTLKRKYSNKYTQIQSFKEFYNNSKSFLVFLPFESDKLQSSNQLIQELLKDDKKITVFLHEEMLPSLKNKSSLSFLLYKNEELSRFNLPEADLEKKISSHKYDIFIDLDFSESLLNYAVAGASNANYRVGFIKKDADKFYNIQIPDNKRNYELSLRNLLNSIRMF